MRCLLSLLLCLSVSVSHSQDRALLDRLCQDIGSSCVVMEYDYVARLSGLDNNGSGNLVAQGQMWKLSGNGIEMFCDGKAVWIIDPTLKEVVIEPVSDPQNSFMTNPAMVFLRLHEDFVLNVSNPSDDGKSTVFYMKPKDEAWMEYMNVEIYKDSGAIRNMTFALTDGTLVKVEVNSMKLTPKVSDETFRPQTVFDSKWIVTDLR